MSTDNDGCCKSCEKLADEIERLTITQVELGKTIDGLNAEIERLRSEIRKNELIVRGASRATEKIGKLRGLLRELLDGEGPTTEYLERVSEALGGAR